MKSSNASSRFWTTFGLLLGTGSCLFLVTVVAFYQGLIQVTTTTIALGIYAGMSPITILAYGWDKRRAVSLGRRIPERTLHLLELFGGWPAALAAQHLVRHKNRKLQYQVTFWAIVGVHVLFWLRGFWLSWLLRSG